MNLSVSQSKKEEREILNKQIEQFLQQGGKIQRQSNSDTGFVEMGLRELYEYRRENNAGGLLDFKKKGRSKRGSR
jgi:hypothetical protein